MQRMKAKTLRRMPETPDLSTKAGLSLFLAVALAVALAIVWLWLWHRQCSTPVHSDRSGAAQHNTHTHWHSQHQHQGCPFSSNRSDGSKGSQALTALNSTPLHCHSIGTALALLWLH